MYLLNALCGKVGSIHTTFLCLKYLDGCFRKSINMISKLKYSAFYLKLWLTSCGTLFLHIIIAISYVT